MKRSRKERILRARDRTKERASRSDTDQLIKLESRGHGHCREAKRLIRLISKEVKSRG